MSSRKTSKLIVVDAGGVILNGGMCPAIIEAVTMESKLGIERVTELFKTFMKPMWAGEHDEDWFFTNLLDSAGIPDSPRWRRIPINSEVALPGAVRALQSLSQAGPVWMLSVQVGTWLRGSLAACSADRYLERIFVSSEMGICKPNTGAYEPVIGAWEGKPEDVLFIDDTPKCLPPAEKLGIATHLAIKGDVQEWYEVASQFQKT